MSHGHWIKKTTLFFCCTITMLSFRLVISTAGFCVVRFHLDYSYIDIFISRMLNAALLAHQIGNWLGVVAIAVAASTTNAAVKVYTLTAANWFCFFGMCFALIFFCAGEGGSLTSFYWAMVTANLFHKTSHAICFEIAPCGENCNNGRSDGDCKADATHYCVASFVASAAVVSILKSAVVALTDESTAWQQLSVPSRPLGQVTITIHGRRSVKTTVDYRAAKWLFVITIVLKTLACASSSLIICTGCENNNGFECDWSSMTWLTIMVGAVLGVVPGALLATFASVICWWLVWELYQAGRTWEARGIKWGVVVAGIVVAIRVVVLYWRTERRPNMSDYLCAARRNRRSVRLTSRLNDDLHFPSTDPSTHKRLRRSVSENTYSDHAPSSLSRSHLELEDEGQSVGEAPGGSYAIGEGHARSRRRRRGRRSVEDLTDKLGKTLANVEWHRVVKAKKDVEERRKKLASVKKELEEQGGTEEGKQDVVQRMAKAKNEMEETELEAAKVLQEQMDNVKKTTGELVDAVKDEMRKEMQEKVGEVEGKVVKALNQVQELEGKLTAKVDAHETKVQTAVDAAEEALKKAEAAKSSANQAQTHAATSNKNAQDASRYARYAWLAADRSARKADIAATSANEARYSADAATELAVGAVVYAAQSAQSAETAKAEGALSAVVSSAAMGTSHIAIWTSAAAMGTSNMAAFVSGVALQGSSLAIRASGFAVATAKEAVRKVECGVEWMKKKFKEIFEIQATNEGRRWKVMVAWGVVGVVVFVAVLGLVDVERDCLAGISEAEVRATCSTAALVGGGLGVAGGMALGAFAKELGLPMEKEQFGYVSNEHIGTMKTLGPVIALAAGVTAGATVGLIFGAIIDATSKRNRPDAVYSRFLGRVTLTVPRREAKIAKVAKKKSTVWAAMGLGALIGATVGILTGLAYQTAVPGEWPHPESVSASLVMDILGLGTVYSIYPGMAPCSITQFRHFNRIDVIIVTLSATGPIAIICVSEFSSYGPEQKWTTDTNQWMWAWYGGLGLVTAQLICQIIVISVMHHPESKMAQKVTSSPVRSGILTVTIVTSGQITATIGYPGIVANSGYNSSTIMLNNTATITVMVYTSMLGEGYLTELKKYEPGKWPTQGMGNHKAFNWWCARAFRNSCHIWSCISTTDLRRDIMLCKQ